MAIATRLGFREQARRPLLVVLLIALPFFFMVLRTYDEAPDAIRRWLEGGADRLDLVLPLGLGEERLTEMLEAAAPS